MTLYRDKEPALTRRTGWKVKWDVRNSKVVVEDENGGETWEVRLGDLSCAVKELFEWVKSR